MSPSKFVPGDTCWFFEVDPNYEPSAWIKECEVISDRSPFDGRYSITDKVYGIPYPFRARENQLFKTEKAAHTHFLKWAKQIHDRELAWLTKHKGN